MAIFLFKLITSWIAWTSKGRTEFVFEEVIPLTNHVPANEIKEEWFFTFSGIGLVWRRRLIFKWQLQFKDPIYLSFNTFFLSIDYTNEFCLNKFGLDNSIKDRSIQN